MTNFKIWLLEKLLKNVNYVLILHDEVTEEEHQGAVIYSCDDDREEHLSAIMSSCMENREQVRRIIMKAAENHFKRYEIDWRNFKKAVTGE